jgi:hypothetical protein
MFGFVVYKIRKTERSLYEYNNAAERMTLLVLVDYKTEIPILP